MLIRQSGGRGASLSRTLWRNLESLPSPQQIDRLISREVARAERNGLHFSLVLFRVRRGNRLGTNERRLALTLLRRARLTDEVGWFGDGYLCVLLPDTAAPGAQAFADSVCELVARKGPRPITRVYSYPFDWIDRDDDDGGDEPEPRPPTKAERREQPARRAVAARVPELVGAVAHGGPGAGDSPHFDVGHNYPDDCYARPGDAGRHRPAHAERVQTAAPAVATEPRAEETAPKPRVEPLKALLVRPLPWWKRAVDVAGAAVGLTLLSPLLAVVAVAIKLTSTGPVVFKQRRAGLGGRPFTIYKFRTMCADAEAKKKALRAVSEQDGPAFKLANDPRVTTVGKFLRKTSIDELPQLWNVLKGDMSLVGPRPLPVDESDGCELWQKRRLDVTPGLTCIWQIKGRSQVTFAEWVRMDVSYMRARTILHDLSILLQTIPAVLLRRGAR